MDTSAFMTLGRHILEGERRHPEATGELSALLSDLSLAAKIISLEVNKAGLVDILGFANTTNVHGEDVKKLDIYAHEIIVKTMEHGGHFCVMASEEEEDVIRIDCSFPVVVSFAETLTIPSASISNVTSIWGTPLGA